MALSDQQKFRYAFNFMISNSSKAYIPNDDGRGKSKYGINEQQFPEVATYMNIEDLNEFQAKNILRRLVWQRYSLGDIVNSVMSAKIFDTMVDIGIQKTKSLINQTIIDIGYPITLDSDFEKRTIRSLNNINSDGNSEVLLNRFRQNLEINFKNTFEEGGYLNSRIIRANKLPTTTN